MQKAMQLLQQRDKKVTGPGASIDPTSLMLCALQSVVAGIDIGGIGQDYAKRLRRSICYQVHSILLCAGTYIH